jgi:asparagine synthase (glutamine-hydrolysing)
MDAIYGFSGRPDPTRLDQMDAVLSHRGGERVRDVAPQGTIGIRHRADINRAIYRDGNLSLGLIGQLGNDGRAVDEPDLKTLANRFRREGIAAIDTLRGAFIVVIRDGETWHLVRDGAGVRTVYWTTHRGRFRFAIEPKSLLSDRALPREIRPGAVAQYLTYSFVPGRDTMLTGLQELKPAHRLRWSPGHAAVEQRWFSYDDPPESSRSDAEWCTTFREAMGKAVRERIPGGDGPLGVFLSGGIDSSIVAAELVEQTSRPIHSYTIHFGTDYPNEIEFARSVAQRLGTKHQELEVRPETFVPRLRKIAWHLDEPIGDPIAVPNFELAGMAASEVGHVFNGEGGDPCFGGPKNVSMMLHHWYGGEPLAPGFRERWYLASYRRAYGELGRLISPEWSEQIDEKRDLEQILTPYFETSHPARLLDKLMSINIQLKGAHLILPKVDRMLGAWGLGVAAPLFDERMLAFSYALPGHLKLAAGVEKIILKEAYRNELPAEVIARPKSGMRVPVHWWFRDELRGLALELLSPRSIREAGIFNPARVRQLLDYNTVEGPGRYGLRLWMLITFELWRRLVVKGESP